MAMPVGSVFQFSSSTYLEKLTGRKARNLEEILELIRSCPDSSIFYHTFSALRKLREVQVPDTNDFAIWISKHVNEEALAEKLMALDLAEFNTITSLRRRIAETIEGHREQDPDVFQKMADEPFYLYDMIKIVYVTDKFAYDLKSFRQLIDTASVDSLFFHFIESRLINQLQEDDFSQWIEHSLHLPELARQIRNIDIHVYTLEELRAKIGRVIDEYLKKPNHPEQRMAD